MAGVYQASVVYGSFWEMSADDIQISIEKSTEFYEGIVMIRYRDSQNLKTKIQNGLDGIYSIY